MEIEKNLLKFLGGPIFDIYNTNYNCSNTNFVVNGGINEDRNKYEAAIFK